MKVSFGKYASWDTGFESELSRDDPLNVKLWIECVTYSQVSSELLSKTLGGSSLIWFRFKYLWNGHIIEYKTSPSWVNMILRCIITIIWNMLWSLLINKNVANLEARQSLEVQRMFFFNFYFRLLFGKC